jgi:predicted phosphodiesterase
VLAQFHNEVIDAVVFGHSHHPLNEQHSGILCFNPGSPTDRIFAPFNSIGILEVVDQGLVGRLIRL